MHDTIRTHIEHVREELEIDPCEFLVEHPNETTHGDYASNISLVAAQHQRKNPREVAELFLEKLQGRIPEVDRIEIAGPGFINFHLSRDFFKSKIDAALLSKDSWGTNTVLSDEEVLIEYTSPNLFKPLHVGNLVGNIIGEALARLYEASGATVRRLNYPSDIGPVVAKGVWGLQKTGGDPDDIYALGEAYRVGNEAYEAGGTEKEKIDAINVALYKNSDETWTKLRERGMATSRRQLVALCKTLGTKFDAEIYESETGPVGAQIVKKHIGDVFIESNGAIVFPGEQVGLHTRVFLNSKGLPTYEAKDVGNFVLKQEQFPHWTQSIVVTGSEQREYFKVIFATLRALFPDTEGKAMLHIPTGFLSLTTGKMSSRKGNILAAEDMIDDLKGAARERAESGMPLEEETITAVAVAALKYQILRQGPGSDIVFDKERALSFEGDSGPYLQYTHARISSVLEKAEEAGVVADSALVPETPYTLERVLYQFPEIIKGACETKEPHKLLTYLTELAGTYNTFYATEKIADPNDVYAPYKAAVSETVLVTLKNGLQILGMEAPRRM